MVRQRKLQGPGLWDQEQLSGGVQEGCLEEMSHVGPEGAAGFARRQSGRQRLEERSGSFLGRAGPLGCGGGTCPGSEVHTE